MAIDTQVENLVSRRQAGRKAGSGGLNYERLAKGLGWFSLGLGTAELVAPEVIARISGTKKHKTLIRSYGLREIAAGIGLLATSQRAPWLWARVAGDGVDLGSLAAMAMNRRNNRSRTAVAIASVAGVTALDIYCASRQNQPETGESWARAEASLIVDKRPEECYRFWRNFQNLPRFMSYLESVRSMADQKSHWVASVGGVRIEWDAEIVEDVENQRIAWRTVEGSAVWHTGAVEFAEAPGGRGTIVRVQMDFGHAFQALTPLARLIGRHPEQMIQKELRRFKQVMETGEVITTEGQAAGRRSGATWLDRLAR